MAAKAVLVPIAAARVGLWDRFQCLAEQRVSEGNLTAGERLWEVVRSSGPAPRLTIRSTRHRADFVECSLDLESGVLTCKAGSAINADPLHFQLLEGTHDMLRRDVGDCTADQAIALILDELVWIEGC